MKVSFFWNDIVYWADYSKRHDCTCVIEISDEQYNAMQSGVAYFVGQEYAQKLQFSVQNLTEEVEGETKEYQRLDYLGTSNVQLPNCQETKTVEEVGQDNLLLLQAGGRIERRDGVETYVS